MVNRFGRYAFLIESYSQNRVTIWIIWLNGHGSIAMEDGLVHFAFGYKSRAQIVLGVPGIRLHLQGRPVMSNSVIKPAFLEKHKAEVCVSHPAVGVSCM